MTSQELHEKADAIAFRYHMSHALASEIVALAREAMAAEREECAKIAESCNIFSPTMKKIIAEAIRKGTHS